MLRLGNAQSTMTSMRMQLASAQREAAVETCLKKKCLGFCADVDGLTDSYCSGNDFECESIRCGCVHVSSAARARRIRSCVWRRQATSCVRTTPVQNVTPSQFLMLWRGESVLQNTWEPLVGRTVDGKPSVGR